MAGTIKTPPITKAYAENFELSMRRGRRKPEERAPGTEPCPHCGRVMRYADQRCACTLGDGRTPRWG